MRRTCLFVHLDGRLVAVDPDNLADELVMAYFYLRQSLAIRFLSLEDCGSKSYQLVHGYTNHVLSNNDWPVCVLLAIVGAVRGRIVVATNPETE